MIDSIVRNIQNFFPIESKNRRLEISNLTYPDPHQYLDDAAYLKNLKIKGESLKVPLYGDVVLRDLSTGKIIDRKTKMKIMDVPIRTKYSTFIVNGNDVMFYNQLRPKSGIYVKLHENGNPFIFFNLAKGYNFNIEMDESGRIMMSIGGKTLPVLPVLRFLGVNEADIKRVFGKYYDINDSISNEKHVMKLHNIFFGDAPFDEGALARKFTSDTRVDPDVIEHFFGKKQDHITGNLILSAIEKYLNVKSGKQKADDFDNLIYKTLHDYNDYIDERFTNPKFSNQITRKIIRNMDEFDDVRRILPTSIFNEVVSKLFGLELSGNESLLNPISANSIQSKITVLGEGGLQSEYGAGSLRLINPSQIGVLDPLATPESGKVGLITHMALAVDKDEKKNILVKLYDIKKKDYVDVPILKLWNSYVAFPDQVNPDFTFAKKPVKAMYQGEAKYVNPDKINYVLYPDQLAFSLSSNLIPFLSSLYPVRANVQNKMFNQSLPLKDPDVPLVQSQIHPSLQEEGITTYEELVGRDESVVSPVDGVVSKIDEKKSKIIIDSRGKKYEVPFFRNYPVYPNSFVDHKLKVKVGDRVRKGQVIADSPFTKDGVYAYGKNLLVGYLPFKAYTFEDSILMSESGARKLDSERLFKEELEITPDMERSIDKFRALYPNLLTEENEAKLDRDGVIKVGSKVNQNEILAVALEPRVFTEDDLILGKISKHLIPKLKNVSLTWDNPYSGTVVEVHKLPNKIVILVKTDEITQIGDKVDNRSGGKGIIGKILPDSEMPRTKDGRVLDMVINPLSVITRLSPSQILETALSKVAMKQGKPVAVQNFSKENYVDMVKKMLKDNGISELETIVDPKTGKEIPNILVGYPYISKLEHQVEYKESARYKGPGYDLDFHPARGGTTGAKSVDTLTMYGLLSHGARANLQEMATYKAEKNDDFWEAIENGTLIPPPKPTFSWDKFISMLKTSGINVEKDGTKFKLMPLTDKATVEVSKNRVIKNPKMIRIRAGELEPEKGGLFDKDLTGGIDGKDWSRIDLTEGVLNPIVAPVVAQLLGYTNIELENILHGKTLVNGKTGIEAIKSLLSGIDIDKELVKYTELGKTAKLDQLDKYNRIIRFLKNLKDNNLKLTDLILTKIPVIPPIMRTVYAKNNEMRISDLNYLYQNILFATRSLQEYNNLNIPEEQKVPLREALNESVKALYGLTDPISIGYSKRPIRGVLDLISKPTPKEGYFQKKVLRKEQDLVGRSTIVPEGSLHPDEIGLPEDMAWKIFEPFLINKLHSLGYKKIDALKMINDKNPVARDVLQSIANERLILFNRAPSLHKYNMLSFRPRIVSGSALQVNPFVLQGYNADFDGDAMVVHVPVTTEALDEARNLLPSRNWLHEAKGKVMLMPRNEAILGLYKLTMPGRDVGKSYRNLEEAKLDLQKGIIKETDIIKIGNIKTTYGRYVINSFFPEDLRNYDTIFDKDLLENIVKQVFERSQKQGVELVKKLDSLGRDHVYYSGTSFGLDDIQIKSPVLDKIVNEFKKARTEEEKQKVLLEGHKKLINDLKKTENNLTMQVLSRGRGNWTHVSQIATAPLFAVDNAHRVIPVILNKPLSSGMSFSDYWLSTYGARRTSLNKYIEVSDPGMMTKELGAGLSSLRIVMKDCGTHNGIDMTLEEGDALDRCLVEDIYVGGRLVAKRNEPLEGEVVRRLEKAKVKMVKVRSPVTCEAVGGICSYCYGLAEGKKLPAVGTYVGVKAAQYVSEPATQLLLSRVYTGASEGQPAVEGFNLLKKVLNLQQIPGQAVLSELDGKVESITDDNIRVSGVDHKLPAGAKPIVKMGELVSRGDALTKGPVHPKDVFRLKGITAYKKHLSDTIKNIYHEQGIKVDPRMFEVISNSMAKSGRVVDPGTSDYLLGDFVDLNLVNKFNKEPQIVDIDDAVNKPLGKAVRGFSKGHVLTKSDIRQLKGMGVMKVEIEKKPIVVVPNISGISQLALLRDDWLARMAGTHLKNTLIEGTIRGWTGDVSPANPMPAIAYGTIGD